MSDFIAKLINDIIPAVTRKVLLNQTAAAVEDHFLPVDTVRMVWATTGSQDSARVISNLTLEHLNS